MVHEGCVRNFLRCSGYYNTQSFKGYFFMSLWLDYKMSPSWPKSAPNEDRGVSANSRSVSMLCLCLTAAAGDSSSNPSMCRIGASSEKGMCWHCCCTSCSATLRLTSKHYQLPQFYSVQHRTQMPSEWCIVVASRVAKETPANSHPSHALSSTSCQGQPFLPHGPPQTHHQPQQSNRAGRERDGHFNMLRLLAGSQSQKRRNTACSWKRGVSSENQKGNLSKPGCLSKGKNNHYNVCLQPTKTLSLTISEDIKANQIWIISKFATCFSAWGWEVSGRGFLGFPRLPWKEFGFVFKTRVHLLSTTQWLQHSKAIVLTENLPAPKGSPQ